VLLGVFLICCCLLSTLEFWNCLEEKSEGDHSCFVLSCTRIVQSYEQFFGLTVISFFVLGIQGLKYNFQSGGTVQLSGPPKFIPRPPFISWVHVTIAGSQIINVLLNVLSMISFIFNFAKFCDSKNVKFECLINYRITIGC